ncbi:MAG: lysophospholipid acyltransferase family protein [Pseudomonadota bacterium]
MTLTARANYLWRLFATGLAFAVFGISGVLIPLLAIPSLYLLHRDKLRRQIAARRMVHMMFKCFIHMMRLLGILSWTTEGIERLNRKGLLVLANHPTLIDTVFIMAFIPNANCIVKSRLLNNPAMRSFILQAGYIANDQSNSLIEEAGASLESGSNLVIFPEGTRTTPGEDLRFQRGAANIAIRCGTDITPVIINCSPPTLSKDRKWHDIPARPVVLSFWVKEDIPISAFLEGPATLGARRLNEHLEQFFTREIRKHGHQDS